MSRYFRVYPWGLQLLLFVLLMFVLVSSASLIIPSLIPRLTGYTFTQLIEGVNANSPLSQVQASLIVQGLYSLFLFFLPAFIFAYLTHPNPSGYLGLKPPGKKIHWLLSVLVILGALPVLELIGNLMALIDFGPKIKASQASFESTESAYLNMPGIVAFFRVFITMALVPAIGEEMFFRGIMMRFVKKRTKTMTIPILFTATIFAASHTNVYGLPSIFLAGTILALIYNLTGSLWCSMLAHLLFNGVQIVMTFYATNHPAFKAMLDSSGFPMIAVIVGAIVFSGSFYLLLKNKTPLPDNWTDDFEPDELPEFDFGNKK